MRTVGIFSLVVMLTVHPSTSQPPFDPVLNCPTRNGCHCTQTTIECIARSLTDIPVFSRVNHPFKQIQMGMNSITAIKNNAFLFLNVTEIYLNSNRISTIEADAFNGVHNQLKVLDLGINSLKSLPGVIGKLSALNILDISNNPIDAPGFDDDVMRQLGDYLHEFSFGSPSLRSWPESLHHLQALQILRFYGGDKNFTTLPIRAFRSFEYTLRKLWIQSTNLIAVPIALQYLQSIDELHIDNNPYIGDAGILIPAFAGVTKTLHILTLENNNMTTFPAVLLTLPYVQNLSLAANSLEFVSDQAVGLITSDLHILKLQSCDLDRIPGALSKVPSVADLDLSYNHITTIEKNDLQHMVNLRNVDVSHNPLRYVSKSTFHDLSNLQNLILEETDLYNVPEALINLPRLQKMSLKSSSPSIECNCDLSWLYCYTKKNTNITIDGTCETVSLTIMDYVNQKIHDICSPSC